MLCSFMQKYCQLFKKPNKMLPQVLSRSYHEKQSSYFLFKQSQKLWNIFSGLQNVHSDCTVGWEFCAFGHPISWEPRLGLSNCVRTLQWVLTRVPLILQGFLKCHNHLEGKGLPCWAPLTTNYLLKKQTTIESS